MIHIKKDCVEDSLGFQTSNKFSGTPASSRAASEASRRSRSLRSAQVLGNPGFLAPSRRCPKRVSFRWARGLGDESRCTRARCIRKVPLAFWE